MNDDSNKKECICSVCGKLHKNPWEYKLTFCSISCISAYWHALHLKYAKHLSNAEAWAKAMDKYKVEVWNGDITDIKRLAWALDMSKRELAERSGVSANNIRRYIEGGYEFTAAEIEKLRTFALSKGIKVV